VKYAFPFTFLLAVALVSGAIAAENAAFTTIVDHYEAIRQVLIEDSTEGVAEHAEAIAKTARALELNYSDTAAGVTTASGGAVKALLPEIEKRATEVARSTDLETVRTEMAELTKPLVRWQALVEGPRPVVAYCPMVKKAWLQPDEAIGNPYAPSMLRCGEVVQR
jgi:hypothetical protein